MAALALQCVNGSPLSNSSSVILSTSTSSVTTSTESSTTSTESSTTETTTAEPTVPCDTVVSTITPITVTSTLPVYTPPVPTTTTEPVDTPEVDNTTSTTTTPTPDATTTTTTTPEAQQTTPTTTAQPPINYSHTFVTEWTTLTGDVCNTQTALSTVTETTDTLIKTIARVIYTAPASECATTIINNFATSTMTGCGPDNTASYISTTVATGTVTSFVQYNIHLHPTPECTFDFESLYLDKHNQYRAEMIDTNPLEWNDDIQKIAQSYADDFVCGSDLVHSSNSYDGHSLGENLAIGYDFFAAGGVTAWFNENTLYDWNNPGFSEATGHFTQLVWAATTQLGCGFKDCGNGYYLVCNYYPTGNVIMGASDTPNILFSQNVHQFAG